MLTKTPKRNGSTKAGRGTGKIGRPRIKVAAETTGSTKQDIILAASGLFAEKGFAGSSIREIAERAGLTKTALYHYFPSKEAVLSEMMQGVMLPPLKLQRQLNRRPVPAAIKLWVYLRFDIQQLCEAPFDYTWFVTMEEGLKASYKHFWEERNQLVSWVERTIKSGIKSGDFIDGDATIMTQTIFTLDEYSVAAFRRCNMTDAASFAEETTNLAMRSILARPSRGSKIEAQGLALLAELR